MGPKRNKFDRIYTDSEHESSEDDSITENPISLQKEGNTGGEKKVDDLNGNNSNSTSDIKSSGNDFVTNDNKFLVTRSKRRYDKPQVKVNVQNKQKLLEKDQNDQQQPAVKKPRRTIKDLDSKIEEANNFLLELNKKLKDRDQEIDDLKRVISSNRDGDSEVSKLLRPDVNKSSERNRESITFHDFPILDEEEEDLDYQDDVEIGEELPTEANPRKRIRSRSRSRSKEDRREARKRKHERKSRSRSRSRSGRRGENHRNEQPSLEKFEETYKKDSQVQMLVKKMVEEQVKQEMEKRRRVDNTSGMSKNLINKSPSDTLLFTPAVARNTDFKTNLAGTPLPLQYTADSMRRDSRGEFPSFQHELNSKTADPESINETLSKLRLLTGQNEAVASTSRAGDNRQQQEQMNQAREVADRAILEAERFKARIQQPNRGKDNVSTNLPQVSPINMNNQTKSPKKYQLDELRAMRYLENEDDEFFHTTCHIDDTLREKIEKGKFVELEKLLQKKFLQYHNKDESRMQLINKDGYSYFVPTIDRDCRIDGIKKWEQAFRAYTTIYCKANPTRAGEILQYIDIIHRAAAIFNWDNVAKYDYVFRQLMAANPHRSWAKVYTQMWNITLNEPIKKFNENGNGSNNNRNHNSQRKKETFCWKYNKNTCTYGKNCRFDHKCSYCGVMGHPVSSCHKKNGKKDKSKNPSSSSS